MRTGKTIRDLLANRHEFIEILLLGVLLSLGVELVSAEITDYLEDVRVLGVMIHAPLVLGLLMLVGTSLVFLATVFRARHVGGVFEALLLVDKRTGMIRPIRGYELSEHVCRAIAAAFLENEALAKQWDSEPLTEREERANKGEVSARGGSANHGSENSALANGRNYRGATYVAIIRQEFPQGEHPIPNTKAADILREALEYVLLDNLSTHLSGYFDSGRDKYITEYTREDVPALLLQNRILSLLSTPLENRALFVESIFSKKPPVGEVYMILGSDGSLFQKFHLALPRATTITRPSPGVLTIENPRLTLNLRVHYEGYSDSLPRDFVSLYVGINPEFADVKALRIEVDATVKRWSLLRRSGWDYYEWVDSFTEKVKALTSHDEFLQRINWEAISAQLFVAGRRARSDARKSGNASEVTEASGPRRSVVPDRPTDHELQPDHAENQQQTTSPL